MKIMLDLTKLVAEGKLTQGQADELKLLAKRDTSLLAINILMAIGVFAISAGVVALLPTYTTAVALGILVALTGATISTVVGPQWSLLGVATTIAGGLTFAGGMLWLTNGHWTGFATAAAFLALSVGIRSALLSALTVLALAALLGSTTGYFTATYFVEVQEPTLTIAVFSLLSLGAYLTSKQVPTAYEAVCLAFSRMSLVIVNFGFWVGSLFGDHPGQSWNAAQPAIHIPDIVFVILWAVGLISVGVWAAQANRRFVVNTVAVFGAIHFYTQWFERLGAQPLSVLLGGVIAVAAAVVLWRYNNAPRRAPAAA